MYKDKDKQREAVRRAVRKHRAKGITKVLPSQGITAIDEPPDVIPEAVLTRARARLEPSDHRNFTADCPCSMCEADRAFDRWYTTTSDSSMPKPQSHNPMMVGYVPPKAKS